YIKKNLSKKFIVSSSTFFISPILIAKKFKEELKLYINYQKLNILIKKNLYPLLLINKILN
ncbi:uncharacterized protein BO95DRAFT_356944, partial [Aspergillus brunneoviolaceus CBS 621.78]